MLVFSHISEMGSLMWVSDMLLPHDPNVMMMDTQASSPFFTDSQQSFEDDVRDRVPLVSS